MNKAIIILLLIMMLVQGMVYAMPVPSSPCKNENPKQHSGGSTAMEKVGGVLCISLSVILLYMGTRKFIDDNEDNDWVGIGLVFISSFALGYGIEYLYN